MSVQHADPDRQVLPRWRSFQRSLRSTELDSISPATAVANPGLDRLREEASAHPGDVWIRADLLSALIAGQERREETLEAAEWIKENAEEPALVDFAESVLATPRDDQPELHDDLVANARARAISTVGRARTLLRYRPRDGITRVDLALAHTVLGNRTTARREMLTALALGAESRFVLRSAAAFFASIHEPEVAHWALTNADRAKRDPWLAAATLAVGDLADIRGDVRTARQMLEPGRFQERAVAELASQLGTLEAAAGRVKPSRALFERSVVDPNENALAQAEWAVDAVSLRLTPVALHDAHEARFREASRSGAWDLALTASIGWQQDQPFSKDAALAASYVAEMGVGDHAAALASAKLGLMSNPGDPMLSNNAAYAAVALGRFEDAEAFLRIDAPFLDVEDSNVLTATKGFLAFRRGLPAVGRDLYSAAVEGFVEERLAQHAAMAICLWGVEEARIGSPAAAQLLPIARDAVSRAPSADTAAQLARFERAALGESI